MDIERGRGVGYTKGGVYAGRRNRYVVKSQCLQYPKFSTLFKKGL